MTNVVLTDPKANSGRAISREAAINRFDEELAQVTKTLNQTATPAKEPRERIEPVILGERAADAMVQGAENLVNEAQALLESCKADRDEQCKKLEERERQFLSLSQKIKKYGETVLSASRECYASEIAEDEANQ